MLRIRYLLPAFMLLTGAQLAHADAAAPAADPQCEPGSPHCVHVQIHAQGVCADDPAKCEAVKKRMQEDAAECRADPQACKEKRRARREAICQAHPDRPVCQKLKDGTAAD